jgi:hypothetical protein
LFISCGGCTSNPPRFLDAAKEILHNIRSGNCDQREVQLSIENIFNSLCGDFPGAVTVRCSAMHFEGLVEIDNEENSRQKQEVQREEMKVRRLVEAFMPGSFRIDPALRFFLDLLRTYPSYRDDGHEPLHGTPESEQPLSQVRSRYPQDPRFAPRSDPGYVPQPVKNETKDSSSTFILFTENNRCLLCGAQSNQTALVLGHVRSHLRHRPYHCSREN